MEIVEMIKISKDFSETPGARYISDGLYSGQAFYENILKDKYKIAVQKQGFLEIDFDDSFGYASSFLSEAFGRLAKDFGSSTVLKYLKLKSDDEPLLIREVEDMIKNIK